jgi:protein ImuB
MSRIVSVWLPRWPILRFLAAQAKKPLKESIKPDRPFVLVMTAVGGPRIAAMNEAAEAAELVLGEPLADARAKADDLQARPLDETADARALHRLALWATRYTPTASPWSGENGGDGFFLDVEGAAHLFGGEERLIADLALRLEENFGLSARLAIAATPGMAWALSRFHPAPCTILPSGEEKAALASLPVEALRLSPETCATLRRLGFKTAGALLDKPRAPFAARFPTELLRRIDQALGRIDEPLVPVVAPPAYHSLLYLLDPIITQEAIVTLASRLMQTLTLALTRDDLGARMLRLSLYRVDGEVKTVDIGLTLPTRNVTHVARMIDLKLGALATTDDAGFGFEAVGLAITRAEPMPPRQRELSSIAEETDAGDRTEEHAALIDTLRQRLGRQSVRRFQPVESHLPERAEVLPPVTSEEWQFPLLETEQSTKNARPLLLLPHAEPAEVIALAPDGPPRRFSWRGVIYEVACAEGPERISAEWWRHRTPKPTRDYYCVEDADGRRFWLFREGLYERETAVARWFVHGLFG